MSNVQKIKDAIKTIQVEDSLENVKQALAKAEAEAKRLIDKAFKDDK